MNEHDLALEAIRKKLVGKTLTYHEIYAIMDQIAKQKFDNVLTTYFAASGYSKGFSNEELYYLTRAMVATGESLHFKGLVADKHSIGGIPGTRTTMIVVPIIAAAGFTIPKSSSRAITTPGGTADDMEVLAKVEFSKERIYEMVKKTNGCIVWGGSFHIAPADDILIKVETPLLFESYDKIIVSIMAKKMAFGSTHVVIDMPYGPTAKVHRLSDAALLKEKFEFIAAKCTIKLRVLIHEVLEPAGKGIGPVLETREALRVLQQKKDRPKDLEEYSLSLAANLLELCLADASDHLRQTVKKKYETAMAWAKDILESRKAWKKMQEIIEAQEGNPTIDSEDLRPGAYEFDMTTNKHGTVAKIDSKNATIIAKILGAPKQKGSGIYFHKKTGEIVRKGEAYCTLYSENLYNLTEAKDSLKHFPVVSVA